MKRMAYTAALVTGILLLLAALGGYVIFSVTPMWVRGSAIMGSILVAGVAALTWRTWFRAVLSSRFQRGTASALFTIFVVGILVMINILGTRYHWRQDMTRAGEFTLSEQTMEVLAELDRDIQATAFFTDDWPMKGEIVTLMREYEIQSPFFSVQFVDPEKFPSRAQEYDLSRPGTIVLESDGRRHDITAVSLYELVSSPEGVQFRGEQALTRGIMELSMQVSADIIFLKGYGGPSIYDHLQGIRSYLTGEGYKVREINLAREGGLPEEADLVVIAGPVRDLDDLERQVLEAYLENEGRLLVLLAAADQTSPQPNLKRLLESVGIGVHDSIVFDPTRTYFLDQESSVPRYEDHPVTRKLINRDLAIVFPRARSLEILTPEVNGLNVRRILTTSNDAWGRKNWGTDTNDGGPDDITGPLALGIAVSQLREGNANTERALVVAVGNTRFATDELLGFQGHLDFFVSSVEWILGEKALITIPPKKPTIVPVFLTTTDVRLIFYGAVIGIPLLVLFWGGIVWFRRGRL